jgi:hypothetical protein
MSSKTPARLSSGLLSRKGMAAPSAGPEARANGVAASDDLGAETTRPQLRQGPAPARSTLADWVAPDPTGARGQVAQKRIRVSLRLDEDRHTRLKLVATQRHCTLQSLFTEAIDEFFVRHAPDLLGISTHLRKGRAATGMGTGTSGKIRRGKHHPEDRDGA